MMFCCVYLSVGFFSKEEPLCVWAAEKVVGKYSEAQEKGDEWTES